MESIIAVLKATCLFVFLASTVLLLGSDLYWRYLQTLCEVRQWAAQQGFEILRRSDGADFKLWFTGVRYRKFCLVARDKTDRTWRIVILALSETDWYGILPNGCRLEVRSIEECAPRTQKNARRVGKRHASEWIDE